MKRDMDLVRKILLAMEQCEHGHAPEKLEIEGYTDEAIEYHAFLMNEAGLIYAVDTTHMQSLSPSALPLHMTWAGHDFLDACRDESQWQRAKSIIGEQVKSAPFDVLKSVLVKLIDLQVHQAFT